MKDEATPSVEKNYRCRTTQKWLDDRKVREKREIFRVYREDPDRPGAVTRRERVVTFYTKSNGRQRIDNELWFITNDPAERERLRAELQKFLAEQAVVPTLPS
jgi:hypothetical protein